MSLKKMKLRFNTSHFEGKLCISICYGCLEFDHIQDNQPILSILYFNLRGKFLETKMQRINCKHEASWSVTQILK